ncbi:EAL domain-containing protein (plasmid) [Paraburkholderia sp. PREW-6R]|uniref:putative bifunctional diguanylate cyclase/phosphodiesterase n=1 Tax=Paraburkholderia sp. PREW-6R TaxID=3141544 RepID=UPI0031F4DF21
MTSSQILTSDMHHALSNREMRLLYQPKYDVQTHEIRSAEALLRWDHPAYGVLPPEAFIRIAERNGMIIDIGDWVINEACRQMGEWRTHGIAEFGIAVNVSVRQLAGDHLFSVVCDAIRRHGIEPGLLTIELTETSAMHDFAASIEILQKLVGLGVRISIDDFGTGYSSLMYLKRLPAAELKIDRGFMVDVPNEGSTIVAAIVALGRALKMQVVAEGVETHAQQAFLSRLGCHAMQGFLFGKPVAPDALMQIRRNFAVNGVYPDR